MLAWSWRRWPELLIDFGRELYVPWRLTEGDVLYRDIAYFNGPLSPYLNSLWFRLFGVGLDTLALVNVVVIAAFATLLYRLIAEVADRLVAAVAGIVFMTVFAFGQLGEIGNYNYVTPYSHEATHGLLLGLLAIVLASRASRNETRWVAAAGLALGLAFLTKAEFFAAAASAVLVGLAVGSRSAGAMARTFGTLALATLLPPLVAFGLLATAMPWPAAFHGTLGPWAYLFDDALRSSYFYRRGLGTLDLVGNLQRGAVTLGIYGLLFAPVVGLALRLQPGRKARWVAAAMALVVVVGVVASFGRFHPAEVVRPLPLFLLALGAAALVRCVRISRADGIPRTEVLRLMLLVFANVLLAKIFFRVLLANYGFALAMPGTLLLVAAMTSWLPRWVDESGGAGDLVRAFSLAAIAAIVLAVLLVVNQQFASRTIAVGTGSDIIRAGRFARPVARTLSQMDARMAPGETLAVLPEGVMLNYLSRRVNPTGHINFMPPELLMFGEASILAAFERTPPDFILLTHKNTSEDYGARFFGTDYGRPLYDWVRAHYRPVWQVGAVPLTSNRFGVQLLERNDRVSHRSLAPVEHDLE